MTVNKHPSLNRLLAETNVAYEAFLAYIALGAGRSLEKTRQSLVKKPGYKRLLQEWSAKHEWQERLRQYQAELKIEVDLKQTEILLSERERYLKNYAALNDLMERMIVEANTMRQTKRALVDDPRDLGLPEPQRRKMEIVTLKLNTRDMTSLASALGTIGKDARIVLGLPAQVDITSGGKAVNWPQIVEIAALPAPKEDGESPDEQPVTLHTNGHKKPQEE